MHLFHLQVHNFALKQYAECSKVRNEEELLRRRRQRQREHLLAKVRSADRHSDRDSREIAQPQRDLVESGQYLSALR